MKPENDLAVKGREMPRNSKTMEDTGSNAWVSILRAVPFRDVSRPFAAKAKVTAALERWLQSSLQELAEMMRANPPRRALAYRRISRRR